MMRRGTASLLILDFIFLFALVSNCILFTYFQHMHCGLGVVSGVFSHCGWALDLLGLGETACGEGAESEQILTEPAFSLLATGGLSRLDQLLHHQLTPYIHFSRQVHLLGGSKHKASPPSMRRTTPAALGTFFDWSWRFTITF
jgi:hypothetical protein